MILPVTDDFDLERIAEQYPEGYPFEDYSPCSGVYQQYMFAYYRHLAGRSLWEKQSQ